MCGALGGTGWRVISCKAKLGTMAPEVMSVPTPGIRYTTMETQMMRRKALRTNLTARLPLCKNLIIFLETPAETENFRTSIDYIGSGAAWAPALDCGPFSAHTAPPGRLWATPFFPP